MSKCTVILSPEFAGNTGRREALAVGSVIPTGAFVQYAAGGFTLSTAAGIAQMITTENIAVAGDLDFVYAIGENVFAAALPNGALVNAKAVAATYAAGALLEIGAGGKLTAQAGSGIAVAVVPSFGGAVVSAGGSLLVQLL